MRFCDPICGGGRDSSCSPPRMPLKGAHEPATMDTQKRSAIHQVFLIFRGRIDFMVRSTLTSEATCSFRRPLPPILPESNPYWLSAQKDEVSAMRGFRTPLAVAKRDGRFLVERFLKHTPPTKRQNSLQSVYTQRDPPSRGKFACTRGSIVRQSFVAAFRSSTLVLYETRADWIRPVRCPNDDCPP
jgi:hypothetical protein